MSNHIKQPFFSIVIPSYNRAELLPATLDLILIQSFNSFEIIIVDDGSIDDTESIIEEKYGTNPMIKYFKKINEERGAARNFGYNKAKGQYVVFFDSDDLMYSDYLETLYLEIQKLNPSFISVKFKMVNNKNEDIGLGNRYMKSGWYDQKHFLKGNFVACHVCVKKDLLDYIPFENDRKFAVMEDWIFILENLKKHRLYLVDRVCIAMLEHADRSMANNSLVIQRKLLATKKLVYSLEISDDQIKLLKGFSFYFCGIHAYLDNKRKDCFNYIWKSFRNLGLNRNIILLTLKNILGYQFVSSIKRIKYK